MPLPQQFHVPQNPLAAPNAVITGPGVRFSVLTSRLLRLEHDPAERFEDRASQVAWFRAMDVPRFETHQSAEAIEIETDHLHLRYIPHDGGFTPQSLSITLKESGAIWQYGDEDPQNLRGTYRTLDGIDGYVPLHPGLISRSGWSLIDDSSTLVFNADHWLEPRPGGTQDFYFFGYGHDYRACLQDYSTLSGGVPLVPRYILGNWWSRYHAYHQDELIALMDEFKTFGIPLSVCIVDMDWHIVETGYDDLRGWTGYTFNPDYFPAPTAFFQAIHERRLKTGLNLHPDAGVQRHEQQYPDFARQMGIDPATGQTVRFDIANPDYAMPYLTLLHHPYEEMGVDFWWLDWQQGEVSTMPGLDPLWMLNHLHYYDSARDGIKRPFIFSRWAGLGSHRYPIGFSGDSVTSWETLAFQPYFTATASNVGFGWWSHDIGGHFAGINDPELYTRWVQFGIFSPVMRLHATKGPLYERRPWMLNSDDALNATRTAMQLRHSLIPYLYTLAWRNATHHLPPIQPMYWAYPEQDEAYACPEQYLFGDDLIVAPFLAPADPSVRLGRAVVWLPEGDWYNFFTGEYFAGNAWHAVYGGLHDIPVFARAGAIVPLAPTVGWGGIENPRELDVHIFAGADGQFTLYEDDGETVAYTRGEFALTRFEVCWDVAQMIVDIHTPDAPDDLVPADRHVRLHLHGLPAAVSLTLQRGETSAEVGSRYDHERECLLLDPVQLEPGTTLTLNVFTTEDRPLSARRDRTYDTLFELVRAFRLDVRIANGLADRLRDIMADPEELRVFAAELTQPQMRALLETLTGAGMHRIRDTDHPERIVLWNNHERPDVAYNVVPTEASEFWRFSPTVTAEHGEVPRFLTYTPETSETRQFGRLVRYRERNWLITLTYFGLFGFVTGSADAESRA